MTVITKLVSAAALAAAIALPASAPAAAGEKSAAMSEDIVVRSQSAMNEWQKDSTKELNRALLRDPMTRKLRPNNAVVEVAFTLGADGKADNIAVLDGNGNRAARRSAENAVRRLGTLADVPVARPAGTRFLAAIIFADNREIHSELAAKIKKSRAGRFASKDPEGAIILLGG